MNAVATMMNGLIDYAGLYPPAGLDIRTAVGNYLEYQAGPRAAMLGRFVVDLTRMDELREAAGQHLQSMRLSVIATPTSDFAALARLADEAPVESVEIKCDGPLTITRLRDQLPPSAEIYFEISLNSMCSSAIDALGAVDARAKLRMGGILPEAFPAAMDVSRTLHTLADRRVAFKATAGLHHPIRATRPLTYEADAPRGAMHGFVNLFCAAAAIYRGADVETGQQILEEQTASAFSVGEASIAWRDLRWTAAEVSTIRREFFTSMGSCSFVEPIQDLEAMGWL